MCCTELVLASERKCSAETDPDTALAVIFTPRFVELAKALLVLSGCK